jgi:hypothetical protein
LAGEVPDSARIDINSRERPWRDVAYRVGDARDVIFDELPVRCRQCDRRNPSALHTLIVFEGFVARDRNIESGRFQESIHEVPPTRT